MIVAEDITDLEKLQDDEKRKDKEDSYNRY